MRKPHSGKVNPEASGAWSGVLLSFFPSVCWILVPKGRGLGLC
jgi:hypothetical protein